LIPICYLVLPVINKRKKTGFTRPFKKTDFQEVACIILSGP
jgi:hypothetical protein